MLSPAVMMIESAIDTFFKNPEQIPAWLKESQLKELQSLGDARVQAIGASGLSTDLQIGYELGLATARVILFGSPKLRLKGIDPEDLL